MKRLTKLQFNKIKARIAEIDFEKIKAKAKEYLAAALNFAKNHKVITALICVLLVFLISISAAAIGGKGRKDSDSLILRAERRDIEETITGSTVVEPNDEYSIVPMITGEILEAPFEEGDHVNEGDLLYKVDASTLEKNIESADIAIAKAKKAYENALKENNKTVRDYETTASTVKSAEIAVEKARQSYNDALRARNDLDLKSSCSGYISKLYVSVGDTIAAGTRIADIVDNSTLIIKVPFNRYDADNIYPGDSAALTLTSSGSILYGVVTEIGAYPESGSGYTSFRKVTIEAENPGAVSAGDTATAMIGDIACNDIGAFEYGTDEAITAPSGGKIKGLYISENSRVNQGAVIAALDSDTAESQINSARLALADAEQALVRARIQQSSGNASTDIKDSSLTSSVETARMSYEDAVIAKEKLLENLKDYNITAPISGTVVTKNMKQGDKIGGESSSSSMAAASSSSLSSAANASSSALAVIYDMSRLKCTLDVDEIEVKKISIGQKVTITADVSDKEYTGVVENIGIEGKVGTNGVTTYPVKIEIIDFDDALLPGMNIDANIVVSSIHNTLSVPSGCVNRGNTVYVKGEKIKENDSAPNGYRTVDVVTGISDGNYIEIYGDIKEGDELYSEAAQAVNPMEQMQEMHDEGMNRMSGGAANGGGGM